MNKAALNYRPGVGADAEFVFQKRINSKARSSSSRAESYHFKSRAGLPVDGIASLLSVEVRDRAAAKYEKLLSEKSQWEDRIFSALAAPMGSELFLESEGTSTLLGAPRFYHSELSTPLHDLQGRSMPTSALPRFAYSDEAHVAAKKVQSKMARWILKKNHAATILQRNYLTYITMKRFRLETKAKHVAARKIQWFCRKRIERVRRRAAFKAKMRSACLLIQCLFRLKLARLRVARRRAKRLYKAARVIQRFIRWIPRKRRHDRGRRHRLDIHSTRIQSLARGRQCRLRLFKPLPFWRIVSSQAFALRLLRLPFPNPQPFRPSLGQGFGSVAESRVGSQIDAPSASPSMKSALGDWAASDVGTARSKDDARVAARAAAGSPSSIGSVSASPSGGRGKKAPADPSAPSRSSSRSASPSNSLASLPGGPGLAGGSLGSLHSDASRMPATPPKALRLTRRVYHRYLAHVALGLPGFVRGGASASQSSGVPTAKLQPIVELPIEASWNLRCLVFGTVIMKLLRSNVLRRAVAKIQRICRKFLARCKVSQRALELRAAHRSRLTTEQLVVDRALLMLAVAEVKGRGADTSVGRAGPGRVSGKGGAALLPWHLGLGQAQKPVAAATNSVKDGSTKGKRTGKEQGKEQEQEQGQEQGQRTGAGGLTKSKPTPPILTAEWGEALTLMHALDITSAALLGTAPSNPSDSASGNGNTSGDGDVRVSSLDPSLNLATLPRKQRQALALLSVFANRPMGCIDGALVSVLRVALRPSAECMRIVKAGALPGTGAGAGASAAGRVVSAEQGRVKAGGGRREAARTRTRTSAKATSVEAVAGSGTLPHPSTTASASASASATATATTSGSASAPKQTDYSTAISFSVIRAAAADEDADTIADAGAGAGADVGARSMESAPPSPSPWPEPDPSRLDGTNKSSSTLGRSHSHSHSHSHSLDDTRDMDRDIDAVAFSRPPPPPLLPSTSTSKTSTKPSTKTSTKPSTKTSTKTNSNSNSNRSSSSSSSSSNNIRTGGCSTGSAADAKHLISPLLPAHPDAATELCWAWLEKSAPTWSILALSVLLEPEPWCGLRMNVTGRVPDVVLASGVLVRGWTGWVDAVVKGVIARARAPLKGLEAGTSGEAGLVLLAAEGGKPRFSCPHCLESFALPQHERQHLRARMAPLGAGAGIASGTGTMAGAESVSAIGQDNQGMLCLRGGVMSWVRPQAYSATLRVLHHRLHRLLVRGEHPVLVRESGGGVSGMLGVVVGAAAYAAMSLLRDRADAVAEAEVRAGALAEAALRLKRRQYPVLAALERSLEQQKLKQQQGERRGWGAGRAAGIRFVHLYEEKRVGSLQDEIEGLWEMIESERDVGEPEPVKVKVASPPEPGAGAGAGAGGRGGFIDPETGADRRRPPGPPPNVLPPRK